MADALFELPPVGVGFAALDALELLARALELLAGARVVDLPRVYGVIDERERAVHSAAAARASRAPATFSSWTASSRP